MGVESFCRQVTPSWEWAPGGAFLDLTGTDRLYGRGLDGAAVVFQRSLRSPAVFSAAGSAPTRLAARLASWCAARAGGGVLFIRPDHVAVFLQPFPVDYLPCRRSVIHRFRQLGVRTFGDLQVVPRDLLRAVFGDHGPGFADEAWGREVLSPDRGWSVKSGEGSLFELVVGVRLSPPVSAGPVLSALRRGLAARALTQSAGGPSGRGRWRLTAFWPEGRSRSVSARGPDPAGWRSWNGLVESLWGRLPPVRKGLLGLELAAGNPIEGSSGQGLLFPEDAADSRLADVLRRFPPGPGPRLGLACEELLRTRGAVWYGPGGDGPSAGMGLVDGRGPGR